MKVLIFSDIHGDTRALQQLVAQPADIYIAAGDLSRLLAERVDAVVPELLPAARRHGRLWRAGSVWGEKGQSLAIERRGPRRGRWRDYADIDAHGDLP